MFRDNFRVRPYGEKNDSAFDWLGIGMRKNNSPAGIAKKQGGYRVESENIAGSILISRLANIDFEDKSSGWSGSLWGDYYIHMLDSNSLSGGGNYMVSYIDPNNSDRSVIRYNLNNRKTADMYEHNTYGIWNLMIQKKIDKDYNLPSKLSKKYQELLTWYENWDMSVPF